MEDRISPSSYFTVSGLPIGKICRIERQGGDESGLMAKEQRPHFSTFADSSTEMWPLSCFVTEVFS
jgi:hypothetical protein